MKNSRRIIAAFVCAVALLALPAQAAPAPDESATALQQLGTWIGFLWDGLVELVVGPGDPPAPGSSDPPTLDFGDGGACIDPNGCTH